MKKLLYILNVSSPELKGTGINSFNIAAFKAATSIGVEFHVNTNSQEVISRNNDRLYYLHLVEIYRNPFSWDVIKGYKQLMNLLRTESFDAIHCNTPIGGFLGRICGRKAKIPKIIYQAHGLHFFKGAPLRNWVIYYPIEKWLARYTDAMITINHEDYELAKRKFHLRNRGNIYYVPGVGIDLNKYSCKVNKYELRNSIGVKAEDVMLISAGDLIERKNYKLSIRAISEARIKNLKLCICGRGPDLEDLINYTRKLNVENQVLFLGFRSDVKDLFHVADIFLFTTKQEGLARSMMEAMACGLPCIVSKIRGNIDLLEHGKGGYLCDLNKVSEFSEAINKLAKDKNLRHQFSEYNLKHIRNYSIEAITECLKEIYLKELL